MGHQRLNALPDTAPWRKVIALIAEGADVAEVAQATTEAALRGLELAKNNPGLVHATHLLTQVVLAARQPDFAEALGAAGMSVGSSNPDIFTLAGAFSEALDRRLYRAPGCSDISEMAQLAAVESLTGLLGRNSVTLFGTTPVEVRQAAYELSTQNGFANLAHEFFSRFTQRFLTYHLGRELSLHVGGNGRFEDSAAHDEFVGELGAHCRETAGIMRTFAGEWYSKQNFLGGITERKARGFANHVLTKISKELQKRGRRVA